MFRLFIKNNLTYSFGHLFILGIALFLLPLYTRYLSPDEYGVIDLLMIVGTLVNLTIALEISQGLERYYHDAKNDIEKKEYSSSAFWFSLFINLLFFLICYLFNDHISSLLFDDNNKKQIFLLAAFAITSNGMFIFIQTQLRIQIKAKESVVSSLVYFFVLSIVTIYLLVIKNLKLEGIFFGQIAGNIVASIVAIYFVRKSYGFVFSFKKFKSMIVYSSPLVLSNIALVISIYIDRLSINHFLGLNDLGIYGVAYRFTAIAGLLIFGFKQALSPLIFKNYMNKNTPIEISKIFNIFVILSVFTVAFSILFSGEIILFFTHEAYFSSASLISILIMAVLFFNMHTFAPGLLIKKKTKAISVISIICAIANFCLNYYLIPIFGLEGAAYSSLFCAISFFIILSFLSNKYYPIPYNFTKLSFLTAFILIFSYGIKYINNEINLSIIILKLLFLIILFVSLSIFLIEKKNLNRIKLIIMKRIFNK